MRILEHLDGMDGSYARATFAGWGVRLPRSGHQLRREIKICMLLPLVWKAIA